MGERTVSASPKATTLLNLSFHCRYRGTALLFAGAGMPKVRLAGGLTLREVP